MIVWQCNCDIFVTVTCNIILTLTLDPKVENEKKNDKENKIKQSLSFVILILFSLQDFSSREIKLTSIFASFSPTSLDISLQTFYHPIYIIFLLYTFLVALPS